MLGEKTLFISDLLKFYYKGIKVSNIPYVIWYKRKAPFVKTVSDARRKGNASEEHKLLGEMIKLIGNSSYSKCITNILKHESVKIVPEIKYAKNSRSNTYKAHSDLIDGYEFCFRKSTYKQNLPI